MGQAGGRGSRLPEGVVRAMWVRIRDDGRLGNGVRVFARPAA